MLRWKMIETAKTDFFFLILWSYNGWHHQSGGGSREISEKYISLNHGFLKANKTQQNTA